MADDLLGRLERERSDADRAYNEALTAVDAALDRTGAGETASLQTPEAPGELPSGWRAPVMRAVREWLAPWIEAQQTFSRQAAAAIQALEARDRARLAAFERFQHALMVFLQQITAFIETKDRQLAANATTRLEAQQSLLDTLPDLRSQVAVVQRATHMLTRRLSEAPASAAAGAVAPASAAAPAIETDDYKYVGFEDQFRGSIDEIRAKLAEYVPIFEGASDVVDIGCGRGEFLALLQNAGVSARGVDLNSEMIAAARDRGLDAQVGDALAYLSAQPDESVGGLFAAQVVEHLQPAYLMRLLEVAFHKLRPGAPLVLETINPACWLAFFSSYIRDLTHVKPIHPETLEYLTRASGFANVSIRYSAPVAEHTRMRQIDLPAGILQSDEPTARALVDAARIVNINAGILNTHAFSYHDYAVVGYRS